MPFNTPFSAPQLATLRTSGYWQRTFVALNPLEIVFQAQSIQTLDAPFIQFNYDNATVGTYSDAWTGMVVYLSHTANIQDAYYRGRVRLPPTNSIFYIGENASTLQDNDTLFVVRDTDLFARIRHDTKADGSLTYYPPPPQTNDLPYVTVLYDADNDGLVTWTPVQTGVVVNADATSIDLWGWDVSGNGGAFIDDATLEHPTFTFEAGFHYLVRVIYEDDEGGRNYQIVHVYAVTRTCDAPVVLPIVVGSIGPDIEEGATTTLTAYADVADLIGQTHCAVFSLQRFGDNSSTPMVTNVLMNGRIRSDSIETAGSAEAGQVQQVTFTVESLIPYLRRLRIPNDIVRAVAAPDEFGEIKAPNPYRMACYAMDVYTTLTHLGSFGVEAGEFEDWRIGVEPRGIDGGFALDVLQSILSPIHAAVNLAPTGELFCAIDTNYKQDRSGVPLIAVFTLQDMIDYSVDQDNARTTSQVIAFGGVFNSTANTITLYTAQSPSIVYGEGGDLRELNREILRVNATPTEAKQELSDRASNDYAAQNPKPLARLTLFDSWAGALIPTNFQRYASLLPASSNTLGVAYGATDYWQLQSVSYTINTDGTVDTTIEKAAETSLDDAQELAALLPNNLSNMNPVLPVLPNDPGFPTDPLENYPTDTPDLDDLQPIDPDSAAQAYTPFPPDVASDVATGQGSAGCKTLAINWRWTANTISSWTTALSVPYLFSVSGSSKIANTAWTFVVDFTGAQDNGWTTFDGGVGDQSMLTAAGWVHAGATTQSRITITTDFAAYTTPLVIGSIQVIRSAPVDNGDNNIISIFEPVYPLSGTLGLPVETQNATSLTNTFMGGSFDTMAFDVVADFLVGGVPVPGAIERIVFRGTGVNPFTGDMGTNGVYADAFYRWEMDEDGNESNIMLLGSDGLYLDNAQYTPVPTAPFPEYARNHRYENQPFTGTGNQLYARMNYADHSMSENKYLNLEMCRRD